MKVKIKQLTSGDQPSGYALVTDGSSGFTYTGLTSDTSASVQFLWKYDSGGGSPSNKKFTMNNSNPSLATQLNISDITDGGIDASLLLGYLSYGDTIFVQNTNDTDESSLFEVNGAPVDNGSYFSIPVENVASGSSTSFSNNKLFGFIFVYESTGKIHKGTTFPSSPETGDVFYRTDVDQLYHYDDSRSKWLTTTTSIFSCGRDSVPSSTRGYMLVGSATQSRDRGFYMKQNGTILSVSVNNRVAQTADANVQVRVNNSTSNRVLLTIPSGATSAVNSAADVDFNEDDIVQVLAVANSSDNLRNIEVVFEVAWRP